MQQKILGVLPGRRLSFLDHMAPLCHILGIPLLLTDLWVKELAEIYYPEMSFQTLPDDRELCLDEAVGDVDAIVSAVPGKLVNGHVHLLEYLYRKPTKTVFTLHGNSDKYLNCYEIERWIYEDIVLFYGPFFMRHALEKGIFEKFRRVIFCGNYRRLFYEENKTFFDSMLPKEIRNPIKRTLLYAPTWTSLNRWSDYREYYSSVIESHHALLGHIPEDFQVIVKFHPHFELTMPDQAAEIKKNYEESDRILFLEDWPLIYPLLAHVDYYLGDYSSVGYDFLSFNRPLFFINEKQKNIETDQSVAFFRCGEHLVPQDFPKIFQIIDQTDPKKREVLRLETYQDAYGEEKPLDILKKEILESLSCVSSF